ARRRTPELHVEQHAEGVGDPAPEIGATAERARGLVLRRRLGGAGEPAQRRGLPGDPAGPGLDLTGFTGLALGRAGLRTGIGHARILPRCPRVKPALRRTSLRREWDMR